MWVYTVRLVFCKGFFGCRVGLRVGGVKLGWRLVGGSLLIRFWFFLFFVD